MPTDSSTKTTVAPPAVDAAADTRAQARVGVGFGIAAYGAWGLFPLYFKLIESVPALEILAHRVLWSVPFLVLLLFLRRQWRSSLVAVRNVRTFSTLGLTAALIAGNWLVFVWAIAHDVVLEVSLGYFINPLLNVLLGFVFLRERLRRWQTVSVVLAAVGVTFSTIALGSLPVIALVLAASFGTYGLLRKVVPVDSLTGLSVETVLLWPVAAVYLIWQVATHHAHFLADSTRLDLLLLAAGVLTALPLLWFTAAAKRLRYTTMGFLQYLAPTGHFLLATLAFGEPFKPAHIVTFGCIWAGLAIYSIDAVMNARPREQIVVELTE